MSSKIYNSIKSNNTFGKIHSVLKNSNLEDYIQITSSEEILKQKIVNVNDSINSKEEFYELLSYIFQSLTNIGYTTYEIISFICETINAQDVFKDTQKEEIIDFIKNSFCFIHTDYSKYPLYKNKKNQKIIDQIVFGHSKDKDNFNIGLILDSSAKNIIDNNINLQRDLKTLTLLTGVKKSNRSLDDQKKIINDRFNNYKINKRVNDLNKENTSVSSILISNPNIRIGTQNSLEISSFFNGITTLEMNKSYPYFNATFILPSLSKQDLKQSKEKGNLKRFSVNATSTTLNTFLFGNIKNKNQNYDQFSGDKIDDDVFKTNMSLFTSPQTLVNLDEDIGHSQNNPSNKRKTSVNDPTQPLLTLKSFSINSNPTKGLMSYKSGRLSLVLHDRTRMNDIAPFVKPDLLGSFGAEILLEYGWSNPDSENPKNPLGYFIGNSKIAEKYMIVNSSLTLDNTGLVNIDLSIAMKGPYEFKNQQISSKVENRILQDEFEKIIGELNYHRGSLLNSDTSYLDGFGLNTKSLASIFRETERISSNKVKELEKFRTPHLNISNKINKKFSDFITIEIINESINLNLNNKLTSEDKKILNKLLSGKDTISDNKIIINNKKLTSKNEILEKIKKIFELIDLINTYISEISKQDQQESINEKKILESIAGSQSYFDPFYPTSKKLYPGDSYAQNYISLGSIINTIVQHYIANAKGKVTNRFDEIQTIFYTVNENSGNMSNESISSFLIEKASLYNFIKDIFNKSVVITPESLITQIILKFVQTPDNFSYGLSGLYESRSGEKYKDPVKPLKELSDSNTWKSKFKDKLKEIYFKDSSNKDEFPDSELKFKVPIIHMNFDCLSSIGLENNQERTILRISIFDRTDSPFSSSSEILQDLYTGNRKKNIGKLLSNRSDFKSNKRSESVSVERKNLENYNKNQRKELDILEKKGIVKKDNNGDYKINFESFSNKENFIGSVKDVYKEIYPSLTFGTQNSVMINANVSTLNENKLSTIFMTRSDRNDQSLINDRITEQLPLIIMPTQASVEIFGCPWINFGQNIFLDFETGTTIDNRYIVTGITHDFSPGKFTTQLTLSYGDNYGQLKNIEDILNEINIDVKRDFSRETQKSGENKLIKLSINPENYKNNIYYNDAIRLQIN